MSGSRNQANLQAPEKRAFAVCHVKIFDKSTNRDTKIFVCLIKAQISNPNLMKLVI